MTNIKDFEPDESELHATTGEMVGIAIPMRQGLALHFESTFLYRSAIHVYASMEGPEPAILSKVEFTLAEANLPSGTYTLPSDKIKNVLYAIRWRGDEAIKTYYAKSGQFVLINRWSELYMAGNFKFETDAVDNTAYSVTINKFELRGDY
ncbi:hypothetical protein NLK61_01730 [Pseudomonas fuscovaginae UPB0736]|uniref:hypothetical protein n=1 Tax=Pseudomonas asplenii TaxID=53407 RepID=UPI0002884C60|nr:MULTISPECIES: hypothetical protein [Pseudomonas]UUQ65399.1 hypothetical protein NLK61_01730 [Pseudomonas fuscovaginae UPB0736]UZE31395.1 hypothetical protein LOY63_11955 [Pseudomonas asplenii]